MPISGPSLDAPADLSRLLDVGLATKSDEAALVSAAEMVTWRELDERVDRLARNLLDLGLEPGDRVASLMPNRPELIIHYLACFRAGLVATPLNYRYQAPELDHALAVSRASIILAHAERADDLARSERVAELPLGRITFDDGGDDADDERRLQMLLDREARPRDLPVVMPDAPALIYFTSGSTGPPKGVTHSHRTFGWIVASLAAALELHADDTILPGSSLSHIGSTKLALGALSVGAPLAIPRTTDGDEILPLMRRTRPTVAYMLPSALFALVRDHDAQAEDFRSLRFVMAAGDKLPEELEQEYVAIAGTQLHEAYGMTEIGTSHLNPPSGPNKLGSVGTNNPTFVSSIRGDDDAELPRLADGRHWVSGPTVMTGYWEDPEATAATVRDGWLDTGDILMADDDAYLWFRGRRKQIIVHDGSNINPGDVEEAIAAHPAVDAVGVVGVHDTMHGENVWAYLTLREGAERPTDQEIIRFARAKVGYKAPEVIVVIDQMPFTATGKVDRTTLKRMAAERVGAHHEG